MPWSHHSHSGQFCGHAHDTLEACVRAAVAKGMVTFCLTEHIARHNEDLYPEEIGNADQASLAKLYDNFYHEARRLQRVYAQQLEILVGFEGEWIREGSSDIVRELRQKYEVDLFVGSVHHVHTIPIDYDRALYEKAREAAGGTEEGVFERYFDAQYDMLLALKPPVVGHFDLIRLKSNDPNASLKAMPGVWEKVLRNLAFIRGYGGVVELNSSSIRKGLSAPYPQIDICQAFHSMGGRFTLSDDSHGVDQIGLNYARVFECLGQVGITDLWRLTGTAVDAAGTRMEPMRKVRWHAEAVADLKRHAFWADKR